jgi:uncharacterized protein
MPPSLLIIRLMFAVTRHLPLWHRRAADERPGPVEPRPAYPVSYSELPARWSAAHRAVEDGDLSTLRRLLDEGADVQDPGDWGFTLLHHAIDIEGDVARQNSEPPHVDMTALLLSRGADPLAADVDGRTPMDWAAAEKHWLAEELFRSWLDRNTAEFDPEDPL